MSQAWRHCTWSSTTVTQILLQLQSLLTNLESDTRPVILNRPITLVTRHQIIRNKNTETPVKILILKQIYKFEFSLFHASQGHCNLYIVLNQYSDHSNNWVSTISILGGGSKSVFSILVSISVYNTDESVFLEALAAASYSSQQQLRVTDQDIGLTLKAACRVKNNYFRLLAKLNGQLLCSVSL